jgi:nitroreductase
MSRIILAPMETYEAIMTRRSVPRCADDRVPERETILKLLEAAVRAPNHHLTQPWRFVVLSGDALKDLGDAMAAGNIRLGKDPEAIRSKPQRAPIIIAIVGRPKTHLARVSEIEEHHAAGAAMQNILLAAHDLGLGAMIRTGPAAEMPEVRDHLGIDEGEVIAGFIYVGYPAEGTEDRPLTRRTPATELTEWRGWEPA